MAIADQIPEALLVKFVDRFELAGANTETISPVFVKGYKVISNVVIGFSLFCFYFASSASHLGPYWCTLNIHTRFDHAIGFLKHFPINRVDISLVVDDPVTLFAPLFGSPLIVGESRGVQI